MAFRLFRKMAEAPDVRRGDGARLYFSPHQDDELLTMGISIRNALRGGLANELHVVLCSDGSKSGVRSRIEDGKPCPIHGDLHRYSLSIDEFIDARDREFLGSCLALGVRPQNIHFDSERMEDGSVSVEGSERIIKKWLARFPGATVCTVSPEVGSAQHRDHRALGAAAVALFERGEIDRLELYVEPYCEDAFEGTVKLDEMAPSSDDDRAALRKAIGSYCEWRPEDGRYAVGYHSVTSEFDDFLARMRSRFHVMSR